MKAAALGIVAWIYRVYYATLRVRYVLPDGTSGRAADFAMRGSLFAVCERDALALSGLMAARRFSVIVAHGRDGDWATALLEAIGCRVMRGSSRRGGAAAMRGLVRGVADDDAPVGMVVDGPLGPDGVAKPGAAWCAAHTGRRLIALGVAPSRAIWFRATWSGMFLPLPFTTVTIAVQPSAGRIDADDVLAATARLTTDLALARRRATVAPSSGRKRRLAAALAPIAGVLVVTRDAVVAALAIPFLVPLWLLPWNAACALGRCYGHAAWLVSPRARRVGAINLKRASGPALTLRHARRDVRLVFGSLGQGIAEGVQFARRYKGAPAASQALFEVDDPELEQRILADPRPRILVTGHLGSWEIAAGLAAARSGRPGAAVVRRIDNVWLNALWRRARVRHATEWIEKHGAARHALDRLRQGHDIAMLLDENGGYRGLFVPFFGRPASTRKTAAVLSLATGAPIVVGACIRRPGRPFLYRLALLEPDRERPPDEAIRDLTARIVATYEAWIREAPLQWRWVHWRWKTRPDFTEERYDREALARAFAPSTAADDSGQPSDALAWPGSRPWS